MSDLLWESGTGTRRTAWGSVPRFVRLAVWLWAIWVVVSVASLVLSAAVLAVWWAIVLTVGTGG